MKPRPLNQDKIRELASLPVPSTVLQHPGMISEAERRTLYGLTGLCWRPGSTIIDAGAFLGVSTRIFCEAIAKNGDGSGSVYSYEYGVFNTYNAKVATELMGRVVAVGENFGELLTSLVADTRNIVRFHFGDIKNFPYDGGPISIAFFDILKSASLTDFVYSNFFPQFQSNTLLYQQDYFHPGHPWIACSMAKYADAFSYVGQPEAERGGFNSAVFVVRDKTKIPHQVQEFSSMLRDEALFYAEAAIDLHNHPVERICVAGQKAVVEAAFDGDEAGARESFRHLLAKYGLTAYAEENGQRHHINRIFNAIKNFANRSMSWS